MLESVKEILYGLDQDLGGQVTRVVESGGRNGGLVTPGNPCLDSSPLGISPWDEVNIMVTRSLGYFL